MSPEEKAIIDSNYDEIVVENYDYNHFDYNNQHRVINASLASVQFEADQTASFTCTINLAPGEMAKLKISAYIYAHELEVHYENVAQFSVPSKGEIMLQDSIGKLKNNMP